MGIKPAIQQNTPVTDKPLSYAGYRFPPDVISYAVWLYYRFPLSLRMAEEPLAARGIALTHETVRRWAVKFGLGIANAGTREGDAPLQVGATSAKIRFGARSGGKPVHALPVQPENATEAAGTRAFEAWETVIGHSMLDHLAA